MLSHEIGHIDLYHVAKRSDSKKKLNKLSSLSTLSIVAGSLISNNSEYLVESLITNQVGITNYFQSFSRVQEREADYYGIETLNKLNLSSKPLIKFLNLLEKKTTQKGNTDEYNKFSSHPVYKERYDIINNNINKSNIFFDEGLNTKLNYIKAKLFGYTEKNNKIFGEHLEGYYLMYAESINKSKNGELEESLILLNQLLKNKQNYSFLLETKADILYANGYLREAKRFYEESIKLNTGNFFAKKRIFEIDFILLKNNEIMILKKLFNEFSFLIEIFPHDADLKNKFKELALKTNHVSWKNFFSNEEKFINKQLNIKDYNHEMLKIKKITTDKILIKLLEKNIEAINEKF